MVKRLNLDSLRASVAQTVMDEAVNTLIDVVDDDDKLLAAFEEYDKVAVYLCIDDALGFLYDYLHISRYVSNHGVWTKQLDARDGKTIRPVTMLPYRVIDVGCASGIQNAFFPNYVGIDYKISPSLPKFHDGASFMEGQFSKLIESGELVIDPDKDFGIANMSLLYGGHDAELFKSVFKRCIII